MASIPNQDEISSLDYSFFGDIFIPNKIDTSQPNLQSLDYSFFGDIFVADYTNSISITGTTYFMLWLGNDDLT